MCSVRFMFILVRLTLKDDRSRGLLKGHSSNLLFALRFMSKDFSQLYKSELPRMNGVWRARVSHGGAWERRSSHQRRQLIKPGSRRRGRVPDSGQGQGRADSGRRDGGASRSSAPW